MRRPRHAPASVAADVQRVDMNVKRTQGELAEVRAEAKLALEVAHYVSLPAKLLAFMSWLELHPPEAEGPLISVVLATRGVELRWAVSLAGLGGLVSNRHGQGRTTSAGSVARWLAAIGRSRLARIAVPPHGLGRRVELAGGTVTIDAVLGL